MAQYHVNPETGQAGVCRAKTQCRFGDVKHFNNVQDAYDDYVMNDPELSALAETVYDGQRRERQLTADAEHDAILKKANQHMPRSKRLASMAPVGAMVPALPLVALAAASTGPFAPVIVGAFGLGTGVAAAATYFQPEISSLVQKIRRTKEKKAQKLERTREENIKNSNRLLEAQRHFSTNSNVQSYSANLRYLIAKRQSQRSMEDARINRLAKMDTRGKDSNFPLRHFIPKMIRRRLGMG